VASWEIIMGTVKLASPAAGWRRPAKAIASHHGIVVGRIAQRRAGSTTALRWALYATPSDGPERLSNTFAADLGRDGVAALLADSGLTLRCDNTVVSIPSDPLCEAGAVNLGPAKIAAAHASHEAVRAIFADARRAAA
jgi:hypothetical protein